MRGRYAPPAALTWRAVIEELAVALIRAAPSNGSGPVDSRGYIEVGAIGGWVLAIDFALLYPGEAAAFRAILETVAPVPPAQLAERDAMMERLHRAVAP